MVKSKTLKNNNKNIIKTSKPLNRLYWASVILSLVTIAFVVILQKYLPPQVPLFYGNAESEEQLASSLGLILPGVVSLSFTFLNLVIFLNLKDEFLQKTLVLTSFVVSLLSAVTTLKIAFLVGSF